MQCSAYLYSFSRAMVSGPIAFGDSLRLDRGSSVLSQRVSDLHWVIAFATSSGKFLSSFSLTSQKMWKHKECIWDYMQWLVKFTCLTSKFLSSKFCSLGLILHSLFRILSDFHLFWAWLWKCIPIRSNVIFLVNSLSQSKRPLCPHCQQLHSSLL